MRFELSLVLSLLAVSNCDIEISIVHTNDIHSHFEETARNGEKFGGIARRKTMIDELRNRDDLKNVVLLDSGDQFSGTLWFYKYRGQAEAHFMKELQYNVMSLGNHEFDDLHALGEFLDNVNFQVVCSNVDVSGEPRLDGNILPSVILDIDNQRIGVIGFVTEEVVKLTDPDNFQNIEVKDILESVSSEVRKLQDQGVNIIVASGHAGIDMDKEIAKLEGVDIVVGAHTETFMYTGTPPSTEEPEYPYPLVVTKNSEQKSLVVTAYEFGKYLGFLKVIFDDSGNVLEWNGNPIFLNESVAEDPDILSQVEQWKVSIDDLKGQVLGYTDVKLEGDEVVCRQYECNLGNFITDSLVNYYVTKLGATPDAWTQTSIAIWNSGSIRDTIPKGNISLGHILSVAPYRNTIERVEVTGSTLRKVLEHSAANWIPEGLKGSFLQYAGLKVTYDRTRPEGSRVVNAEVRCAACPIPEYLPLDDEGRYFLLAPSFLVKGGDGYSMLTDERLSRTTYGQVDSDIMASYVSGKSPITHGLEGRIKFIVDTNPVTNDDQCNPATVKLPSVALLLACVLFNLRKWSDNVFPFIFDMLLK